MIVTSVQIFGKPEHLVRAVMAFGFEAASFSSRQLTIRDHSGNYTNDYIELTQAYHAKDLRQ